MRLRDRPVALVTGAAGGIGAATVAELIDAGYAVIATDVVAIDDPTIRAAGGFAYSADLTDPASTAAMVELGIAEVGVPVLVACIAGTLQDRPFLEIAPADWRRTIRVHLGGTYHVARAVVPAMSAAGGGAIVATTSGLAFLGHPSRADYVAAKAAIVGFARALARELGPVGIRVNVVAPGPVDTPMLKGFGRSEGYVTSLPLGRIGQPSEIATAIRMLGEATWTTGQVYGPNGGAVIQ